MDDDQLIRAFEGGQVPAGGFGHTQHVRVAWWYLRHYTLPEALDHFRTGLRRFAAAQGAPQRYHETITTAYVLLIAGRLDSRRRAQPWEVFAAENGDLLAWRPSILERYYTRETLWSEVARQTFVRPDGALCEQWLGSRRASSSSRQSGIVPALGASRWPGSSGSGTPP